ncbi:hypothetical protein [Microbacterium sp. T2.11-28]|uniref:hypothetical protein n=1 Tax=Microbacterium sp. T2.11-28 TaxID=3041169 RepID=UPI00253FD500|nr:hypothetical protein [Microbacterium sp. T2.11-28]
MTAPTAQALYGRSRTFRLLDASRDCSKAAAASSKANSWVASGDRSIPWASDA